MSFSVRFCGCMLLVIASTLVGFSMADRLKNRRNFLRGIIDFLNNLQTHIRYSGEDIFSLIEKSTTNELLYVLKDFSDKEYWSKNINNIPKSYGLASEDMNLLSDFGANLGTTDVEGQTSHIKLYEDLFLTQLSKAEEEWKTKSKLYKMLGFFAGTATALMIL